MTVHIAVNNFGQFTEVSVLFHSLRWSKAFNRVWAYRHIVCILAGFRPENIGHKLGTKEQQRAGSSALASKELMRHHDQKELTTI